MNTAQNTTISSNDNSSEPTPQAVARVISMLYGFFDEVGADWKDDIRPNIQSEGIGLVAVAAAQDAQKRIGAWGVVNTMVNAIFLLPQLASERAKTTMGDPHIVLAVNTIGNLANGNVDTSDQGVFDEIYEACTPRNGEEYSLFGYCLLQVALAALNVSANDQDPFAWPALNIANELASRVSKDAASEFAASLRRAAARAARAERAA